MGLLTKPIALCSLLLLGGCEGRSPRTADESVSPPRALWQDATAELLPRTAEWTHRVTAADLDGDGDSDLLFANGGAYSTPGVPERNRVFLNQGAKQAFVEATDAVFGSEPDFARSIEVRDLNGDGVVDVVVACAYGTPSRLFLGEGDGRFVERTELLPQPGAVEGSHFSFGDVEVGDLDDDGDLDLVLVDWGPGDAMSNRGGSPRVWINRWIEDGQLRFVDETVGRLSVLELEFSWDLELHDVDGDFDLDVLVSCKRCAGGVLLRNDGSGRFAIDRRALPQYTNNYDYAGMDLNGDGALDLVSVNDGDIIGAPYSRREHLLINRPRAGLGQRFEDRTFELWPPAANLGEDDNAVEFLDFDSDGDADFLLASLTGADRLLVNDGRGGLLLAAEVFGGTATPGTLSIALADFDGDHRLDVAMAQGEHQTAVEERIFLGLGLAPDTAPPAVSGRLVGAGDRRRVVARVHDRKSPVRDEDFLRVELRRAQRAPTVSLPPLPLAWFGGQLWRSQPFVPVAAMELCAIDRAGNERCVPIGDGSS